MFKFIQQAITELEHVVWPTQNETKKYMTYTVGVIIVLATFLAILGYGIRLSLTSVRDQFPHEPIQTTVSGEDAATKEDLDNLLKNLEKKKAASGSVSSGTTTPDTTLIIGTGTAQ